jgi:hypothetical protein
MKLRLSSILCLSFVLGLLPADGQLTGSASLSFAPLTQWTDAITSGNSSALKALYSTTPPAQIAGPSGNLTVDQDVAFWRDMKAKRIVANIVQSNEPQPGVHQIVIESEVHSTARISYVTEGQVWQQQAGVWKIVSIRRTDAAKLLQPASTSKDIYPEGVDAHAEINEALARAGKSHKRVILVFGGNWCFDCHVLDRAFQRPDLAPVIAKNYEIVHVDIGNEDKNQDLLAQYGLPKNKVPVMAVLDSSGKIVYSQTNGEFSSARSLAPEDLLQFLNKWKPSAR